MTGSILVIGGTGVFGCRLVEGLVRDGHCVTIAARTVNAARATAQKLSCKATAFDKNASDLDARMAKLSPFIVIDAAGPFQSYEDYCVARAAIRCGAHYLDLSDDARFTAGIRALDDEARAASVVVRSGVSSVPAISAAAVRELGAGWNRIDRIESYILPGNRAPRGRAVSEAILSQVGHPLPGDAGERGWMGRHFVTLNVPGRDRLVRRASPIGAPDRLLFPGAFNAKDVRFCAGLELGAMHEGLRLLAFGVCAGLLPSATALAGTLHRVAGWLERFGTDRGGMLVRVTHADVVRTWTLLAEAGDGPHVPAIPGRIMVNRLMAGQVNAGAQAALFDITLDEVEAAAPERSLAFHRA